MFVPNSFTDGSAGGTPITAATLNNLENGLVAADITNPASAATTALALAITAQAEPVGLSAATQAGIVAAYMSRGAATRMSTQSLPSWSAGRALVQLNQTPFRILCVGDSTTAGVYSDSYTTATGSTNQGGPNSFPAQLVKRLQAAGLAADYSFCLPGHSGNDDSRWALGAWGYSSGVGAATAAGITSANPGQVATVTPGNVANRYTIYYYGDSGTGTMTGQATGGTSTSINTVQATAGVYSITVSASAASAANVLTFTTVSGTVFVLGVESFDSTNPNKIRVMNAGVGGSKATDWANDTNTNKFGGQAVIKAIAPNLTIISLGVNDGGVSAAVATVTAAVETLAVAAALSGDVVIMSAVPHNAPTLVDQYNAGYYAGTRPYIDLQRRWGNAARSMGLQTTDNTHPNALGYGDMATAAAGSLLSF